MVDAEDDYTETFGRLTRLESEIKRYGPTPGRLAARANLELAVGNVELALNSARELEAMADGKAASLEAARIVRQCEMAMKERRSVIDDDE